MRKTDGMDRKKVGAALATAAAALTIGAVAVVDRSSAAAADRENLKKQRAALGAPDPEEMRARMLDQMAKTLGLTENQKRQFKEADQDMGPNMGKIFQDKSLSQQQKMQKMQELGAKHDAALSAMMTPDQQAKYQQMQDAMRKQWGQRQGGGGGGRPGGPPPGGFPGAPPAR